MLAENTFMCLKSQLNQGSLKTASTRNTYEVKPSGLSLSTKANFVSLKVLRGQDAICL